MFDFLKRFFPKKGEPLEDLDDDMYGTETDSLPEEDDDEPVQSTRYKVEGLLMDFIRKFRKHPDPQEAVPDPVFVLSANDEEKKRSDTDGLLGKLNNLEGAPKYAFLGVATFLLVSVLYGGVHLFRNSGKESPQRPPSSQVQQKKETAKDLPANPMLAAMSASAMENPFVETAPVITDIPASARQMDIPASARQISPPSSMPVIPSTPRPSIPSVSKPMPIIPSGAPESSPASAPSGNGNSIQGVITSSNPNDNIAIMGDGSVVSVGETFRDGRIAYIGGDGITFEDGSKLNMQQP